MAAEVILPPFYAFCQEKNYISAVSNLYNHTLFYIKKLLK